MASTLNRDTSLLTLSCLRLGVSVGRMQLVWDVCRLSEKEAEERGEGEPRGTPRTNKRGICEWKPPSVILKKLSPLPCPTDHQGPAWSDCGLLTKRQNPLSLLACFNHCFSPLASFEVLDESVKTAQVDSALCFTERKTSKVEEMPLPKINSEIETKKQRCHSRCSVSQRLKNSMQHTAHRCK